MSTADFSKGVEGTMIVLNEKKVHMCVMGLEKVKYQTGRQQHTIGQSQIFE